MQGVNAAALCRRYNLYLCSPHQMLYLLSLSGHSSRMTTRKLKLVGLGHQLLDQGTLSDAGWSAYDHSTGKTLFCLDYSRSGSGFRRRGSLRAFRCAHLAACTSKKAGLALNSRRNNILYNNSRNSPLDQIRTANMKLSRDKSVFGKKDRSVLEHVGEEEGRTTFGG